MSKFNKTITTSVLEQIKSALIIALIVAIAAFALGVKYQKHSAVSVNNQVIVSAETTAKK